MSDKLDTSKISPALGEDGFAGMVKRHMKLTKENDMTGTYPSDFAPTEFMEPTKETGMTNTDFTGAVSDEILARENLPPLPPKIELIGKHADIRYETASENFFTEGKILGFTGENIFLALEVGTRVILIPTGRIVSITV